MTFITRRRRQQRGLSGPTLAISASSVIESALVSSVVGVLSVANGSGTYTFTKTADPDAKFTVSGSNLTLAAALDYEAATSHSVTISASNGVDAAIVRTFTINVTNAFEAPTLAALSLDDNEISQGVAATVNILGATAGSTITGSVPAGLTLNSAARTITGTPTTIADNTITLTETMADSANSPRVTAGLALNVVEAPAFVVQRVVIEGDSITSTTPDMAGTTGYGYAFKAANPTLTVNIRAQGSRSLGTIANLNDDGNTLWGNQAEDMAYNPDLFTVYIGANGPFGAAFPSTPDGAGYWTALKEYLAAFRAAGVKVGVATITPFDVRHPSYVNFNANRDAFNAVVRAQFAESADFFIPFGEIPEFNPDDNGATNNPMLIDGVHHAAGGVTLLENVYAAVMNPFIANSTDVSPTAGAWFGAGTTTAAPSTTLTMRYVVTGMLAGYGAALSMDAATIAAGVKVQIGRNKNLTNGTVYNGDVVILSVPTSASYSTATPCNITIGARTVSVTVQTAATDPAVITYDPAVKYTSVTLSNLNRRMTNTNNGAHAKARATEAVTGKRYCEFTFIAGDAGKSRMIGIMDAAYPATTNISSTGRPGNVDYPNSGITIGGSFCYRDGSILGGQGISDWADNDVAMLCIDTTTGKVYWGKNGTWATNHDPAAGTGGITLTTPPAEWYAYASVTGASPIDINCGQDAFSYAIPSGYSAWG